MLYSCLFTKLSFLLLNLFPFQLTRPAQELLMSVALNCNTHTSDDIEVIGNLIKVRLKTKPLANHYISCIKWVCFCLTHSIDFWGCNLFHSFVGTISFTDVTSSDVIIFTSTPQIIITSSFLPGIFHFRELVNQHPDNLGTTLKHVIYNELSQQRNPNNMAILQVIFQIEPENAAKVNFFSILWT